MGTLIQPVVAGYFEIVTTVPVALVTNTPKTIASLLLNPGEYDISAVVQYLPAATTSMTHLSAGTSLTTDVLEGIGTRDSTTFPAIVPGVVADAWHTVAPTRRLKIDIPTTIYVVAHALFTVSTMTALASLRARVVPRS